jgi:hypothetical protein
MDWTWVGGGITSLVSPLALAITSRCSLEPSRCLGMWSSLVNFHIESRHRSNDAELKVAHMVIIKPYPSPYGMYCGAQLCYALSMTDADYTGTGPYTWGPSRTWCVWRCGGRPPCWGWWCRTAVAGQAPAIPSLSAHSAPVHYHVVGQAPAVHSLSAHSAPVHMLPVCPPLSRACLHLPFNTRPVNAHDVSALALGAC